MEYNIGLHLINNANKLIQWGYQYTNSLFQNLEAVPVWKEMLNRVGTWNQFAHKRKKWIVGFSILLCYILPSEDQKVMFSQVAKLWAKVLTSVGHSYILRLVEIYVCYWHVRPPSTFATETFSCFTCWLDGQIDEHMSLSSSVIISP